MDDGGLNCHLIPFCDILLAIVRWFKALKQADNSFPAPVKSVPLSDYRNRDVPLHAMNLSIPITQELLSIEFTTSIWSARVVTHVKGNPQRFSVERLTATQNGPKKSIPELEKGRLPLVRRLTGRSAIIGFSVSALRL